MTAAIAGRQKGVEASARYVAEMANGSAAVTQDFRQKGCQILGHVVDVLGRAVPGLDPCLGRVVHVAGMDQHCRHAEVMCGDEIVRHVLEHGGLVRRDAVGADHMVVGFALFLRDVCGGDDVADVLEQVQHAEFGGDVLGMAA